MLLQFVYLFIELLIILYLYIQYYMTWTAAGLQLNNATSGVLNLNFAQNINNILMAKRGNEVVTGCVITADASSNLTTSQDDINMASGTAIINGAEVTISAQNLSLFDLSASGGGDDYNTLLTGEAVYIIVYLDATGTIQAIGGTAGTGVVYPAELPENTTALALIYLIEGTTVLIAGAIRDYRIFTPAFIYAASGKIAGAFEITGAVTLGDTIDGVDLAALKVDVDGFPDELKNLATAEIQQIENIGSITITNAQWGYVGNFDQDLITTSNVTFANVTASNLILAASGTVSFEGATDDSFETLLTVVDPTVDRTITLPNVTGTVITTGNLTDITSLGTISDFGLSEFVTLYPNFRNLTGWSFNSTDDYLSTVDNKIDEDCVIYINLKSHMTAINAEIQTTVTAGGSPNYTGKFYMYLEVLNSAGTWTTVDSTSITPSETTTTSTVYTLTISTFGTIEVGNHYRLRFLKSNISTGNTSLTMKLYGIELVY